LSIVINCGAYWGSLVSKFLVIAISLAPNFTILGVVRNRLSDRPFGFPNVAIDPAYSIIRMLIAFVTALALCARKALGSDHVDGDRADP